MSAEVDEDDPYAPRRFRRAGTGLEFDRLVFFSDAVFAIALTLVVVGIGVPKLANESSSTELLAHLDDIGPSVFVFFLCFAVISSYWRGNHRFVATLAAIDDTYATWTLVYLACIAFLPFPAGLMGSYSGNPVAVSSFAVTIAVISVLVTVQLVVAQRHALFRTPLNDDGYRWALGNNLVPVGVFAASVPIIFVNPTAGMLFWIVDLPLGAFWYRRRPPRLHG